MSLRNANQSPSLSSRMKKAIFQGISNKKGLSNHCYLKTTETKAQKHGKEDHIVRMTLP